jgi:hypothetical protein
VALSYKEFNASSLDFLLVEASTGLMFSEIGLGAGDDLKSAERNALNARKAYDGVLRFRDRVPMSKAQSEALDRKIEQLPNALLKRERPV